MASRHQRFAFVGEYVPLYLTQAGTLLPAGMLVNTTSPTTISPGSQAVQVASLTNITMGMLLWIVNGAGTAEVVQVTGINTSTPSFTATFANAHSGAYNILSLRGSLLGTVNINNPGTGCTLQLWNGHPNMQPAGKMIANIPLVANMPTRSYHIALDQGLFYTLSVGSGAPDVTIGYLDQPA